MKIKKGILYLQDKIASNPYEESITYWDKDENYVNVPYSLLFGLYDVVKHHMEKRGYDFETFKDDNLL